MGQMIIVDEDEYNEMKIKSHWCDSYRKIINQYSEKMYPHYTVVSPTSGFEYDELMLKIMLEDAWMVNKPMHKKNNRQT